jgi:methylmalonyl-CoA mutase N-terminal domain/subunit
MSLMDPDHPLARYTVGTQGASLCRHDDYHELLDGIPLGQMATEEDTLLRGISEEKIEPLFDRVKSMQAYRDKRDRQPLLDSFKRLHDVVQPDENMLDAVLECTQIGATMGEVAGILRQALESLLGDMQ